MVRRDIIRCFAVTPAQTGFAGGVVGGTSAPLRRRER